MAWSKGCASAALLWLLSWAFALQAAEPLTVVTEELPPYNMVRNGKVTGMSTEVVEAVLRQADLQGNIRSMPWARAYDIGLHGVDVLIYSIARTPERESLFQWVGSIAPSRLFLYSVASHPIQLKTLDDARHYQIGTVKDDVSEQYLIAKGFVVGQNLQSSNKYESNYEKLKLGHVDLWVSNEMNAHYLARSSGADPSVMLVPSLALDELSLKDGLYLACSVNTSADTVERLRVALKAIEDNGVYAEIVARWL
ncbi:transporter substrate-binding domain-containing protein [Pseudomonas sp. dw_358]|uniref:substrate-binding periplasmic protein n=1 Tax=Pseudomonas sp. dw_358 TaxID=2720083 RepID=UPI001BD5605C|nr:transporter substrate-binding domain-containing protein [Pseudomonas sp. dw_358]